MPPTSIFDRVKLGRGPLRVDPRTIQYRALAPSPWTAPASYSWDDEHHGVCPPRMYLNDTYGCCVISARANHAARMEFDETGFLRTASDLEVKGEYFGESHGVDGGLDPIASLNAWRRGWVMGGKAQSIHSWAQVAAQDPQQVKEAAITGQGLQCGVRLPLSAGDQMNAGKDWDLVAGPDGEAGSWGNHMVYVSGYDAVGVLLWTWGRVVCATWRWMAAYCDFAALAVDNPNSLEAPARVRLLGELAAVSSP